MPYRQRLVSRMRTRPALIKATLAAIFLIAACGGQRPLLNSERIEMRFGSYGVDVIASDGRRRLSSLYSLNGGVRVCRTYAVVRFAQPVDPAYAAEHARVAAGQSIGAVFKSAGWTITKRHTRFGETALTGSDNNILKLMKIELPQKLATHTYVFEIAKDGQSFDYAVITEMHHPDYLTVSDLVSIYGNGTAGAVIVNAN